MRKFKMLYMLFLTFILSISFLNSCAAPDFTFCSYVFYKLDEKKSLVNNEISVGIGHTFGLGTNKEDNGKSYDGSLIYNELKISCYVDYEIINFDFSVINDIPYKELIINGNDFLENYQMNDFEKMRYDEIKEIKYYNKKIIINLENVFVKNNFLIVIHSYDVDNQINLTNYYIFYGTKKTGEFSVNYIKANSDYIYL